jgi:signal transduction histidine kinase
MRQARELTAEWSGVERRRVQAVVETLATLRGKGESLEEMAHDARNMVTALGLYCDLLEEPGVLATPFAHYGNELRLVAAASRRLVEKLVALDAYGTRGTPAMSSSAVSSSAALSSLDRRETGRLLAAATAGDRPERNRRWDLMPAEPIENLAQELLANRNLLAALAGPPIALTVEAEGGGRPVRLTGEDLSRVLVNLVKNAAEAMPRGGRIRLCLRERRADAESPESLVLTIEDDGPGIPVKALEKVFESGYSTRVRDGSADGSGGGAWAAAHRGLGLSIARAIVEAAGGRIHVANRSQAEAGSGANPEASSGTSSGASLEIELPVRGR